MLSIRNHLHGGCNNELSEGPHRLDNKAETLINGLPHLPWMNHEVLILFCAGHENASTVLSSKRLLPNIGDRWTRGMLGGGNQATF